MGWREIDKRRKGERIWEEMREKRINRMRRKIWGRRSVWWRIRRWWDGCGSYFIKGFDLVEFVKEEGE